MGILAGDKFQLQDIRIVERNDLLPEFCCWAMKWDTVAPELFHPELH
jgi:hypothetical protein